MGSPVALERRLSARERCRGVRSRAGLVVYLVGASSEPSRELTAPEASGQGPDRACGLARVASPGGGPHGFEMASVGSAPGKRRFPAFGDPPAASPWPLHGWGCPAPVPPSL